MPLILDSITDLEVFPTSSDLLITWSCTHSPSLFQVYLDRTLAWSGRQNSCYIPLPSNTSLRNVRIDVGEVDPEDSNVDYSSQLQLLPGLSSRVQLSWYGGTYLDSTGRDNIGGFLIYGSTETSTLGSQTTLLARFAAYPGGWITDGFGLGPYGDGGFGMSATSYSWTSDPMASGTWFFSIVCFDKAGNSGSTVNVNSVTILAGPQPVTPTSASSNFTYQYPSWTGNVATLNWSA